MDKDVIAAHLAKCSEPARWGQDDCALWAADLLHMLTGQDLAAKWRGLYASETEATALMAERGGGLVRHVMRAARDAGWRKVNPPEADRPSLGLVPAVSWEGERMYVCAALVAPGWFAFRGVSWATNVPGKNVARAWSCP